MALKVVVADFLLVARFTVKEPGVAGAVLSTVIEAEYVADTLPAASLNATCTVRAPLPEVRAQLSGVWYACHAPKALPLLATSMRRPLVVQLSVASGRSETLLELV